MSANAPGSGISSRPSSGRASAIIWIAAAIFACLSVLFVNGRPLFYFDTLGYISQGHNGLRQLGWQAESPLEGRSDEAFQRSKSSNSPAFAKIDAENTVDGSRSTVYALLTGALARLGAIEGLIALNVIAVFCALWIPMRIAVRTWPNSPPLSRLVAIPVLAASLGSLPFFITFLMPDTFAPVLLIVCATFAVFARQMRVWEILFFVGLGSLAVVSHLSHLAIAALLVPIVALGALILSRHKWWLAPVLVMVIVGIGFAEQSVLRSAAKAVSDSVVVVKPYITARLIQDGPGMRYLEARCPDEDIPTCELYGALMMSDDPYRLTATHIVFETSEKLGSFRHLAPDAQRRVADDQIAFFFEVLVDDPVGIVMAFIKNTFIQAGWVSVEMTLPTDRMVSQHDGVAGLMIGSFTHGRITQNTGWLGIVTPFQQIYYLASLVLIGVCVVAPRRVTKEIKVFAVMLVLGILANALVCGGISQPATRYGARVIWLLPMAAAIMLLFAARYPKSGEFAGTRP